jgi:hypothetical protein
VIKNQISPRISAITDPPASTSVRTRRGKSTRSLRFAAVTQLNTGANSHYNGLQFTAENRFGHGPQGQINYTWSHCIDTVSNGGFLQFSASEYFHPCRTTLREIAVPCAYDIRNNLTGNYVYELPFKLHNRVLAYAVNGWQISGSVFWHSGIPFSTLSAPYSASRNGNPERQRTAVRQGCARRATL